MDSKNSTNNQEYFPFLLFVNQMNIQNFTANENKLLKSLTKNYSLSSLQFENDLKIPDLDGKILKIDDKSMSNRIKALEQILSEIIKQEELKQKRKKSSLDLICLVPEGMVSILIGAKGKQIKSIIDNSGANIVINQPIYQMNHRTIKIEGRIKYILRAFSKIYTLMEDKSYLLPGSEPNNNNKITQESLYSLSINACFIFDIEIVDNALKSSSIKKQCEAENVKLSFYSEKYNKCLKRNEEICKIIGKLKSVQKIVLLLLDKANSYKYKKKNKEQKCKLLIPNQYVTKLIGAKGCMVKEIANKSGGAQIKIMSNKEREKYHQECIVKISGELASRQDACCIVLEQIEIFKNGGPVLLSGKNINDDLAGQVRNSLQLNESNQEKNKKKSPEIKRVPRSRSRSKEIKSHRKQQLSHSQGSSISYKYDSDYSEKQNSAEKIIRKKSAKSSNSNDAKEIKISEKKQSKKNTNNNNDQLETNQQTTYEISKDFAYKLYNASENIIQLSSLIPIELLNKFQEKQNSIEEKSGAKILFESEKLYYFANNEQQCFLIKILGTSSQYIQTLKIIFNLLNDKPEAEQ